MGGALVLAALVLPTVARADEPRRASEPRIFNEPGEVTNVVDAFDDDNKNPFDIHITLGFQQSFASGKIRRESAAAQGSLSSGGFTSPLMNVASYSEHTSRLNTRVDVGIWHDIALYLRMPLILSNTRDLSDLDGSSGVQHAVLQGAPGEQLFSLPFKSPSRSGIEYFAVGLDADVFNQTRDPSKPTWLFGVEGRFSISEPMHACGPGGTGLNQGNQQVTCADPSDVNRDGVADRSPTSLEGSFSGSRSPGVSRGTTGLEVHTMVSRRIKYIEPYGGFRALIEFGNSGSDYGKTNVTQVLTSSPPIQGWFILGTQIIPYEVRENFQRLTFDLRAAGSYRSEGRDYSPLFDAIGSSDAPSVRRPNFAEYQAGNTTIGNNPGSGSVVNQGSQKIYATGLTDVAAHGMVTLSASAMFQAGEYIKFQVGTAYTFIQSHFITGDQPCNANFKSDITKTGGCQNISSSTSASGATSVTRTATGVPNPLARPAYDYVGQRFKVDDAGQLDLFINAIVMF